MTGKIEEKLDGRKLQLLLILAGLLLYGLLVLYVSFAIWPIGDWNYHMRGTISQAAINGDLHKYDFPKFNYPPWILPILAPLATIPNPWGTALMLWIGIVVIAAIVIKFGKKPWKLALVFLSPPFIMMVFYGGFDWLPLSGLLLPPAIGLVAMSVKPQVGITAALTWLQQAPTWRARIKIVLPAVVIAGLALIIWPGWPTWLLADVGLTSYWFNYSIWPWGLIPAIALGVYAWRKQDQIAALAIMPLAAPYLSANGWVGFFVAMAIKWPWACLALDIAVWIYAFLRYGARII
jgi:hypothetical protein